MPTAEIYTLNIPFMSITGEDVSIAVPGSTWTEVADLESFLYQGAFAAIEDDEWMWWSVDWLGLQTGSEVRVYDKTNAQAIVTWVKQFVTIPRVQGPLSTLPSGDAEWVIEVRYLTALTPGLTIWINRIPA